MFVFWFMAQKLALQVDYNQLIRFEKFLVFNLPDDEEIPFLLSSTMLRIEKTDFAARGPAALLATFGET